MSGGRLDEIWARAMLPRNSRFSISRLTQPAAREPSTFATIDELLTDGDAAHVPIRLCLDVGHQVVPGTSGAERDPYAWLARYAGRLVEVQLQQGDGEADHHDLPEISGDPRVA